MKIQLEPWEINEGVQVDMTPPRVSYSITRGNFYSYYRPT
jgi:hypothetical protein